ncbi:MAG: hypothetical protein JWM23_698 [Microbacteriaceae bacterium]|nr:hypothetical protein [Microbacteriaceae bacterium]
MPTNEDLTPVEDIAEFLTGVGWESLSEAGREQFRALFHQARGRAADGGYVYRSVDRLSAGIEVGQRDPAYHTEYGCWRRAS